MRKLALLLLLPPVSLAAQSIQTISPQQCVWRAGDNLAWAAPNIDETAWQPYTQWKGNPNQPRIWVRCHANLSALHGTEHLALQASAPAAYELYVNGELIGGAGNLGSGNYSTDTIRSFLAPQLLPALQRATLAARMTYGYSDFSGYVEASPLSIRAGDQQILEALRAAEVLSRIHGFLNYLVLFAIIGVLAFVLFGLFLFDRLRHDLLLLSICSLGLAAIYAARYSSATLAGYSVRVDLAIYTAAAALVLLSRTWIVFVLAGRRMPLFFWIVIGLDAIRTAVALCGTFLPLHWSLGLATAIERTYDASICGNLACAAAPFVAFWPYTRIRRSMIPIAALCMAWGAFMMVFFISGAASFSRRISPLASLLVSAELFVTLCVIILLMGLLLRDQQRTAQDRAELAGEMASAREVQQYFIPEKLPGTPGLAIQSVYLPSREVGGDFFQVLPDARDGSTLIVVGDVAGKGLKAGMLSALIVGAIRTAFQFTSEPGEILALLNQRLQGRGLVTCQVLRIASCGSVELANAGHLPPYVNGQEVAVEGSLPLGAVSGIIFDATRFQLIEGDSLLLVSDGIVEAQNQRGELFGFDRTRTISNQSAEAIARAAQAFGQQDDITVLTLTFAGAAAVHA
ncbi:MAG: PP2C family protein-serine/threonine phosphatase [Terracidiphilus sp.]